ncbi:MAG: RsmB/NOP family class I SAM-dependent RNA methyltransferase [archaeon]
MASTKTYFPQEFLDKYSSFLGKGWEEFFATISKKQPKCFWVNTAKSTPAEIIESLSKKGVKFSQLAFDEHAFFIEMEKPGDLEEYKFGKISLQEKAAMMPAAALAPKKGDKVLDACAAPGMKTLQLSNFVGAKGKVIACDVNSERFKFLCSTISKFGLANVEAIRCDFRNLSKKGMKFDKVLLDAPCSSEGLVRKDFDALRGWSLDLVKRKSEEQKKLIISAFDLLKEGGEMVYATCSFAPEEDEDVVRYLLMQRQNAKVIPVELTGIKIRDDYLCSDCVRLYPQDNDTQQFFFAKIKKE